MEVIFVHLLGLLLFKKEGSVYNTVPEWSSP